MSGFSKKYILSEIQRLEAEIAAGAAGPLSQIDVDVPAGTYSDFGNGITGWADADVVVINPTTGTVYIEGFYSSPIAGIKGEKKIIRNDGTYSVFISHMDVGAVAEDKIFIKQRELLELAQDDLAVFYYDTEEEHWYQTDAKPKGNDLEPTSSRRLNEYTGSVGERVPYEPASFTGNKRITFPPGPSMGDLFAIKNVTGSTAIINVYSASQKIEDPISGGVIAAATDIPIGLAWIGVTWQFMSSEGGYWAWHVVGG